MPDPAAHDVDLEARLARVELLLMDVDGVLTDGGVTLGADGVERKTFHIRDGLAVKLWQQAGCRAAFVTGRSSRAVELRAVELGIPIVRQGVADKLAAASEIVAACGVPWERTAFIGDDLPDLAVVRRCGVGVAVADACPELVQAAAVVTRLPGGRGAVRELVERMLRARGAWDALAEGCSGTRC